MKERFLRLTVMLVFVCLAGAQIKERSPKLEVYSNAALGFRLVRPSGMQDTTARSREAMRERASALHTSKILDLLLAMTSGEDDTVQSWHSLSIETYPRSAFAALDDPSAEAKMSSWAAHSRDAATPPRSATISGQRFSVSVFGLREGNIKKGAVVWTTIRRGKLLSFAFAANSPEQLQQLTESMKTLEFF